jgi:hypothetical protein
MKQKKFVELIERVKRGRANVFIGFVVSETKTEITLVCSGPEEDTINIKQKSFELDEYDLRIISKEEVVHGFNQAQRKAEAHLMESEFEYHDDLFITAANKRYIDELNKI